MVRRIGIVALLLATIFLSPSDAFARSRHHSTRPDSSSDRRSHSGHASRKERTQHVDGYYRSDGTYVRGYDRHPAGTKAGTEYKSRSHKRHESDLTDVPPVHATIQRDANGRIHRSSEARAEFKREHPCPVTRRPTGACPGWVIDHVIPLKRGGPDHPSNMQWQTSAEAKAKDRWE